MHDNIGSSNKMIRITYKIIWFERQKRKPVIRFPND